jgi:hypothetical protein
MSRTCKLITILLVLFCWSASSEAGKKNVRGGPCSYDNFMGECIATAYDKKSDEITFSYVGKVGSENVTTPGNMAKKSAMEKNLRVGDKLSCRLSFITKGTCTPCLFKNEKGDFIGSCSKESWELFRRRK